MYFKRSYFKANLGYLVGSQPTWDAVEFKQKKQRERESKRKKKKTQTVEPLETP